MAVTMVIGNTPQIVASLFAPGLHAGQRDRQRIHRGDDRPLSARFSKSGWCFSVVTILVNLIGQLLLRTLKTSDRDARCVRNENRTTRPPRWRKFKNALASTLSTLAAVLVIAPLGLVFFYLLKRAPGRSTGISSPNCPSPSARPAAAWPTPSSARSCSWASPR